MDYTLSPFQETSFISPMRIFLVEDSLQVRNLIMEELCNIPGLVLAGFSEGEDDALEKISKEHFDVLILDIELKQGNGMHLLSRLDKQAHTLKIIFSNNIDSFTRRTGKKYGAQFFFDKSFEMTKLHNLLVSLGNR